MSVWQRIEDFNHLSLNGIPKCFNCGGIKRKSEEFVYRPQAMDDFSGFPDLCEGCIVEAAALIGMIESDVAVQAHNEQKALDLVVSELLDESAEQRAALSAVTRENVRLQDVIDDYQVAVSEQPYNEQMLIELEEENA